MRRNTLRQALIISHRNPWEVNLQKLSRLTLKVKNLLFMQSRHTFQRTKMQLRSYLATVLRLKSRTNKNVTLRRERRKNRNTLINLRKTNGVDLGLLSKMENLIVRKSMVELFFIPLALKVRVYRTLSRMFRVILTLLVRIRVHTRLG